MNERMNAVFFPHAEMGEEKGEGHVKVAPGRSTEAVGTSSSAR